MMGCSSVACVVNAALLDVWGLSDFLSHNELLDQILQPAITNALLHRYISDR
jgi:hypothetical protein